MDYNILYKDCYSSLKELEAQCSWDLFISAYNSSDRVKFTYKSIKAKRKIWIIHYQYGFTQKQLPQNEEYLIFPETETESINVRNLFEKLFNTGIDSASIKTLKICVDCTGFMRPDLMFLMLYMRQRLEIKKFDVLYSEPSSYSKNENTTFSKETTGKVKAVEGFELASKRDVSNDLLIIGSGFDDVLIAEVAEAKKHAQKIQIIGFPSLQADMYQQNLYRASKVDEIDSSGTENIYFAPANDPFETANVLRNIIETKERIDKKPITNLYLSPLSTKAQTIGFALFYINECIGKREASVLIPESKSYSEKTSIDIANIWRYQIEFSEQKTEDVSEF